MRTTSEGEGRARQAVTVALARREWNPTDLQKAAGIDQGTVLDFLSGSRWPKIRTQSKIEQALGWPPGAIAEMRRGGEAPADDPLDPSVAEGAIDELAHVDERERAVLLATLRALRGTPDAAAGSSTHRAVSG